MASVTQGTAVQLDLIHRRLLQEKDQKNSFVHNLPSIESGFRCGTLFVATATGSNPCGFMVGDPNTGKLDILNVWKEHRQQGIGQGLANHFIELAHGCDAIGVRVECPTPEALDFWERKMGFSRGIASDYKRGYQLRYRLSSDEERALPGQDVRQLDIFLRDSHGKLICSPFTTLAERVETSLCYILSIPFRCAMERSLLTSAHVEVYANGVQIYGDELKESFAGIEVAGDFLRIRSVDIDWMDDR